MNYKSIFVVLLLIISFTKATAQIIAPDTVCVGTSVNFSSTQSGISYTWTIGDNDITPTAPTSSTILASGGNLSSPSFTCNANDNGNWYSFSSDYGSDAVIRMSHGTFPTNIPVSTNLGNMGLTGGEAGGIDIIKDEVSGNWYGFVIDGSKILRMDFGSSLSNTPTSSIIILPFSTVAWPHDLKIKKVNTQWIGFIANRSGGITRLDFGTNITATPTATLLPLSNLNGPVSFSLINESGNWYMFVANLFGGIARLDFGNNLQNNNPTSVNIGNFGQLYLTRHIIVLKDCDQMFAYVVTEYSQLYKLDFNNIITNNTPALSSLGSFNYNFLYLYSYASELKGLMENSVNGTISTATFESFNSTVTNYYNNTFTNTFDTPGVYNISLAVDQGRYFNSYTWCKQIVVLESASANLGPDTSICGYPDYVITPSGLNATNYIWSTGANTPTITVNQSGDYWIHTSGNGECNKSDTIHIAFYAAPSINVSPADTVICQGQSVSLTATGGAVYHWSPVTWLDNPNLAQTLATPENSIVYYLEAKDTDDCYVRDSVAIKVLQRPILNVTPKDTTICMGASVRLKAQAGLTNYSWTPDDFLSANNIANPIVTPTASTNYIVSSTNELGCESKDTVVIKVLALPSIKITSDSNKVNCTQPFLHLASSGGVSYLWTPANILDDPTSDHPIGTLKDTTTFYVLGTDVNGCKNIDSITIELSDYKFFFVPSAFSPNGDGLNDEFLPKYQCDLTLENFSVYNRFGQRIFFTLNKYKGWNGLQNLKLADMGTYYWYIEGMDHNHQKISRKGDVTLIR